MSEEKGGGFSLRTKRSKGRPPISAPKQISAPLRPANDAIFRSTELGAVDASSQRMGASGKTSDLVKRRYSTRFANLPKDYDPSVPPVPSFNRSRYDEGQPQDRRQSPTRRPSLTVDINAIRDPNLQPEQYVANILSDATEQEIQEYQQTLQKMRNRTSVDLQQNVYQNRTQFIKISKEAEKLKGEMRALRNLMAELKSNTIALRTTSSLGGPDNSSGADSFPSTLSKRDKRSSVADRTAMWNSQLQALWKSIEGSQKYLPAVPGRHVVQNAGVWIELDNATWKSRRVMQIILLNDHLLVASRKKRKVEGTGGVDARQAPSKLVADRCWPLLDIEVRDLATDSESGSGRNKVADAIMVRGAGQESFTYRSEKSDSSEKGALLLNFRKAVDEIRRSLRSDVGSIKKSPTRDSGLLKSSDSLDSFTNASERPNMLIDVDGKQQNLRWVDGQVDQLDIDIALQHFEAAVSRVEKLNGLAKGLRSNIVAQDYINAKVKERATRLAGLIIHELVDAHNELKKTKLNVDWLNRLGFEDRAREAYLGARSEVIQKRIRQCIFEGNLHQYVWQISFVYFTIIRNSVATFQASFPPFTMSACVKWAKEQVDAFNVLLERQLSGAERGGQMWMDCMNQAKEHAKMLSEVGLDFKHFIGKDAVDVKQPVIDRGNVGLGLS